MKIGFEAKRIFHNKTGLGNYSRSLLKSLSESFPENEYFLYNPKGGTNNLFTASAPLYEKRPQKSLNKFFSNYWRQRTIVSDLTRDSIKIFHGLSGEIPAGLAKTGIKSVVTIHDLIFLRFPEFYSYFDKKIHSRKFYHAAKNADVIVAVSEQTKNDIVTYYDIPSSKIKVIYQSCHPAYKQNYSKTQFSEVLHKYSLPEDFILNVGTIEKRKNVLVAVKAIKNIDTHLVIVGSETAYTKDVKEYIDKHNLRHKVSFLKGLEITELAILNQMAQLLLYPSLFEGFGIPIIEALYSKTPVITTNYGCFPEAGGPNSIYVDPTNTEEISTKIKQVLSNQSLRVSMAENGFEYVQKFNEESIAAEMMDLYHKLLQ